MNKLSSAFTALFLCLGSGCSWYGGVSVHLESQDAPEFFAPNPIGILGGEYRQGRWIAFCEHQSSIPYFEQGLGLNSCGVKMVFNHD